MNLRNKLSLVVGGWIGGVSFAAGWLLFEVAWEVSPLSFFMTIPFLCLWVERAESDQRDEPWSWGWSLVRLTIWKTEFRLDIDLNIWGIGLTCVAFDDLGIYVGPFNVQIETDKMYDVDFPPGVPTLRAFFPSDRSVKPWPPRCECDTLGDHLDGDDETDPG